MPSGDVVVPKCSAQQRLEATGIDGVCAAILEGGTLTSIARKAKVSQGSLINWLAADSERSARAREARAQSAWLWDEEAVKVIAAAKDALALGKARELAHHFRWRASKIAPREYGERVALQGGGSAAPPVDLNLDVKERFADLLEHAKRRRGALTLDVKEEVSGAD